MQRAAALVLMLLSLGFPVGVWLASACDPLFSQQVEPEWLRVLPVDELTCDGAPREVSIYTEHRDAWTRFDPRQITTVFVRCDGAAGSLTILLNHDYLGCPLEYDSARQRFWNRCFDWEYDIRGQVIETPKTDFPAMIPLPHRIQHGQLFVSSADQHW